MSRYFLALPLPESVRERLAAVRPPGSPGIKTVRPDLLHVTLHFLGELSDNDLEVGKKALSEIRAPRFQINVCGIGTFPAKGLPRVVWAGIDEAPELSDLHRKIGESLLQSINFQPEERSYTAHITLARVKPPAHRHRLQTHLDRYRQFKIPDVAIDRFVLYESLFVKGRLEYREAASWNLVG